MTLDITLRDLTGAGSPVLIGMIGGAGLAERLPTEFPDARDRRVDSLVRLADGRILHLEWQAGFDAAMPRRMLDYRVAIMGRHPADRVEQAVIQVGGGRPIADGLETAGLSFRYRVIDSRALDPAPLLASAALDDNILSVLFGGAADLPARIRAILGRLAALDRRRRNDAVTRLLILAGLRRAAGIVFEEAKAMPLQIDIERDPYLAQLVLKGRAEGRAEGEAEALLRLAERRFGPLPAALRARVLAAGPAAVECWLDRLIDAPDLETLFAEPPGSRS